MTRKVASADEAEASNGIGHSASDAFPAQTLGTSRVTLRQLTTYAVASSPQTRLRLRRRLTQNAREPSADTLLTFWCMITLWKTTCHSRRKLNRE